MGGEESAKPVDVDPRWCVPKSIARADGLILRQHPRGFTNVPPADQER